METSHGCTKLFINIGSLSTEYQRQQKQRVSFEHKVCSLRDFLSKANILSYSCKLCLKTQQSFIMRWSLRAWWIGSWLLNTSIFTLREFIEITKIKNKSKFGGLGSEQFLERTKQVESVQGVHWYLEGVADNFSCNAYKYSSRILRKREWDLLGICNKQDHRSFKINYQYQTLFFVYFKHSPDTFWRSHFREKKILHAWISYTDCACRSIWSKSQPQNHVFQQKCLS